MFRSHFLPLHVAVGDMKCDRNRRNGVRQRPVTTTSLPAAVPSSIAVWASAIWSKA